MYEYVSSLKSSPGLLDIVAMIEDDKDEDASHQRYLYPPHWSMEKIRLALKVSGILSLVNPLHLRSKLTGIVFVMMIFGEDSFRVILL